MPKTLFLFNDTGSKPRFFVLEGDYSHLNGIYINEAGDGDQEQKSMELSSLIYTDEGKEKVEMLDVPTKDWTFFVHVGFLA